MITTEENDKRVEYAKRLAIDYAKYQKRMTDPSIEDVWRNPISVSV